MGDPHSAIEREAALRVQFEAAERAWQHFPAPPSIVLTAAAVPSLLDAIDRVRALHFPYGIAVRSCSECEALYPCPTIAALDGVS